MDLKKQFLKTLKNFYEFSSKTIIETYSYKNSKIPIFLNEFWLSKQRQSHSLHEISYRACFKAELPSFFISNLSNEGDVVYDPFSGRGTTALQACLMNRIPYTCDINPLSKILLLPRLSPPSYEEISNKLETFDLSFDFKKTIKRDPFLSSLLNFFHIDTLSEMLNLRKNLVNDLFEDFDIIKSWISMVATNRLTGHSKGFFSVYTLPPNQAVSVKSQIKINNKLDQKPEYKDIKKIILKKSKSLLRSFNSKNSNSNLVKTSIFKMSEIRDKGIFLVKSCDKTPEIASNSVNLVITSPPFLDVVDYKADNWLRSWFNGFDISSVNVWQINSIEKWSYTMTRVFYELKRVLAKGGFIAFEVGEVRNGKIQMEDLVIPIGVECGFEAVCILINDQEFTKTSQCWGIDNSIKGTNTNRIIVFQKM